MVGPPSGPIYADEMAESSRVSTVRLALMNIADALGDVDAFIEQYDEKTRKMPKFAAEIAQRLLSAGRVEEAWQAIEAAERRQHNTRWNWPDFQRSPNVLQALCFLVRWPALDRAATLVLERAIELDGDHYEILTPAAEALAGKHPLAATMLLRAMINFSLKNSRSSRYRHAARHLLDCAGLSPTIKDYRSFEPHGAYEARLRLEHGRQNLFWRLV